MRNALSKFDTNILLAVLKAMEQLITCNEGVGEVLMSYGKNFMGPISFFMDEKKNIGDKMDYAQRRNNDVGEEVILHIIAHQTIQSSSSLLNYYHGTIRFARYWNYWRCMVALTRCR